MSKELEALIRIEDLLDRLYETDVIDDDHTHDINIIGKKLKRLEELEKAFKALSKEDEKAKKLLSLELPEKDTPKDISRTELREYLINFTKEDCELIEHGVMEDLDNVREFIHYLREGDSDITGKAFDDTVDKIISYILS